jgi:peptidoglycan-N-acetylglucosamine deacetylase
VNDTNSVKYVHLTFDDGPHDRNTSAILEVLKTHEVHATFFVLGKHVARCGKTLLQRAAEEGHRIGNHGFTHKRLVDLAEQEVERELADTEVLISEFLGPQKLFRPPYGASNRIVKRVVTRLGYRELLWDVDTLDWHPEYQSDRWVEHAVHQIWLRKSSIVLAHDKHMWTVAYLDRFLCLLRDACVSFAHSDSQSPLQLIRTANPPDSPPERY